MSAKEFILGLAQHVEVTKKIVTVKKGLPVITEMAVATSHVGNTLPKVTEMAAVAENILKAEKEG
jgi:PII-like signaling protein